VAKLTLKYLLLDDFSEQCTSESQLHERVEKYRFYQYCAQNWLAHTSKVKHEDDSLFEIVNCFVFDSPANLRSYRQIIKRICHGAHNWDEVSSVDTEWRNIYGRGISSGPDCAFCKEELDRGYQLSDVRTALFGGLIESGLTWIIKRIVVKRPELLDANVGPAGPPLRIAALMGDSSMVEDLLNLGADIHQKCSPYDLPAVIFRFHEADAWYGSTDSAYYYYGHDSGVLRKYVPVSERLSRPIEDTPFEFPVHTISQYAPDALPLLLRNAPDEFHKRCGDGSVPIHYAVLSNSLKAVQTLVAAGADINAETNAGRTLLHIAVSLHNGSIAEFLLDCNVAIPPDITANELDFADAFLHDKFKDSLGEDFLRQEKEARSRLSQKVKAHQTPQAVRPHFIDREDWVRTTVLREEKEEFKWNAEQKPYVSITITGKSLKRVVFRIQSLDTGTLSSAS